MVITFMETAVRHCARKVGGSWLLPSWKQLSGIVLERVVTVDSYTFMGAAVRHCARKGGGGWLIHLHGNSCQTL